MSTTTANDCWVQFWENDNYESGGTHRFSYSDHQPALNGQPYYVNDLAEYYWDGYAGKAKNQLDDSINSLKTGPATWLYVFSTSRFGGMALKVPPGSNIPLLGEVSVSGMPNWRNTIASFVLYDHQPNGWDTGSPTLAASCWLKLYAGLRYTKTCFTLYGAGDVISNRTLDGYAHMEPTWVAGLRMEVIIDQQPVSLATGPATWVRLYSSSDSEFNKPPLAQYGPNSLVRQLPAGLPPALSLQVFDAPPGGFSQSTTTPPLVATLQQYQTAAKLEGLLEGVVGLIPEVGGVFSLLLSTLWPSGPGTAEIWNDMTTYMQAMMTGLLDQTALNELNGKLQDYRVDISRYVEDKPGPDKAKDLKDILTRLDKDERYFLNESQPQQSLTYLLAFGTISVLMRAERAYNYLALSTEAGDSPPADADAELARTNLAASITRLTQGVNKALVGAVQWRTDLIQLTNPTNGLASYHVTDAYTSYTVPYDRQADAERQQQQLRAYVSAQYEAQLRAYAIPAGLWGYLTPANTQPGTNPGRPGSAQAPAFPTITFRQRPERQVVRMAVGTMNAPDTFDFQADLGGSPLRAVGLYHNGSAAGLVGLQLTRADGQVLPLGKTDGAATVSVVLDADGGEALVALYGGSGSWVDELYLRTNKGRDFGLGDSSGGTDFFGAAPQGTDARLMTVAGTLANGYISSLTFTWEYQAATPYQE